MPFTFNLVYSFSKWTFTKFSVLFDAMKVCQYLSIYLPGSFEVFKEALKGGNVSTQLSLYLRKVIKSDGTIFALILNSTFNWVGTI